MELSKSTIFFYIVLVIFLVGYLIYLSRTKKEPKETEEQRLARQEKEKQKRLLQQEWEDQKDGYQ